MSTKKSSLDSYQQDSEKVKNKKSDELAGELSDVALSYGDKLMNKFDFGGMISNFTDALDKLGDLPFGDKLKELGMSFLNSQLDKMKVLASESAESLWRATKNLVKSVVSKALGIGESWISIPDHVFFAAIYPLHKMKSNLRYKNDYVRKVCIKSDFSYTLEWIDQEIGFSYSLISNKSKTKSTIMTASENCAVNVYKYMFDKLKEENDVVKSNIRSYEYELQENANDIKAIDNLIDTLQEEFMSSQTSEIRREELKILINNEKEKKSKLQKKENEISNAKSTWDDRDYDYRSLLAQSFKKLLVESVAWLDDKKVRDITLRFGIKPAWFGDYDPDFNRKYAFSTTDVNRMAPFYKDSGLVNDLPEKLDDTVLLDSMGFTPSQDIPKFITLRNIMLKYIYILLNSTNIYGQGNQLSSQILYERLKYPTMDYLTELGDKFAGEMIKDGLGKALIDAINKYDQAIYDFTVMVEPALFSPFKVDWDFQLMAYHQTMPAPIIPPSVNNSNKTPPSEIDQPVKGISVTRDQLDKMLKYYFNYLNESTRPNILINLFKTLKNKYDTESDTTLKSCYKTFIIRYFGEDSLEPLYNPDIYKSYQSSFLFNVYNKFMQDIYCQDYKTYIDIPDYSSLDTSIEDLFYQLFDELKNNFYKDCTNRMSDADITSALAFIYLKIGEAMRSKYNLRADLLKFAQKHFTENAYTVEFSIEIYLDELGSSARKQLLLDVLIDLNKEFTTGELKKIYKDFESYLNQIYSQILPEYSFVIKVEEGGDIDIDDPNIKDQIEAEHNEAADYNNFYIWYRKFDNTNVKEDGTGLESIKYPNYELTYNKDGIVIYNPIITKE